MFKVNNKAAERHQWHHRSGALDNGLLCDKS